MKENIYKNTRNISTSTIEAELMLELTRQVDRLFTKIRNSQTISDAARMQQINDFQLIFLDFLENFDVIGERVDFKRSKSLLIEILRNKEADN